jgi:hypothetical protein
MSIAVDSVNVSVPAADAAIADAEAEQTDSIQRELFQQTLTAISEYVEIDDPAAFILRWQLQSAMLSTGIHSGEWSLGQPLAERPSR